VGLALGPSGSRIAAALEELVDVARLVHRATNLGGTTSSPQPIPGSPVIAGRGELERAARLLAYAVRRLREIEADVPRGFEGDLHERALARVRRELPDVDTVWAAGEAMTQHEAIELALGDQVGTLAPPDVILE
jgi:hypothetical protein